MPTQQEAVTTGTHELDRMLAPLELVSDQNTEAELTAYAEPSWHPDDSLDMLGSDTAARTSLVASSAHREPADLLQQSDWDMFDLLFQQPDGSAELAIDISLSQSCQGPSMAHSACQQSLQPQQQVSLVRQVQGHQAKTGLSCQCLQHFSCTVCPASSREYGRYMTAYHNAVLAMLQLHCVSHRQ